MTQNVFLLEKKKTLTPIGNSNKQSDNTKTPQKTTITQRLRTDLARSVGVTTASKLAWLNWLNGSKPSH